MDEIAGRENLIPGIHNYCDRWCQRCAFVDRCSVGIMETESDTSGSAGSNQEFWDKLSVIFKATIEMINAQADKMGIDLSDAASAYKKPVHRKTKAEKLAREYALRMHAWLKTNQKTFTDRAKTYSLIDEGQKVSFEDAVEVIEWYSFFIAAKIHRATLAPIYRHDDAPEADDKNGSAKIALIALNRSLEALAFLYNCLPEQEDEILGFMAGLSQIRKLLTKAFPHAMLFKRPGFDDRL